MDDSQMFFFGMFILFGSSLLWVFTFAEPDIDALRYNKETMVGIDIIATLVGIMFLIIPFIN
jgi:hypothetical protein